MPLGFKNPLSSKRDKHSRPRGSFDPKLGIEYPDNEPSPRHHQDDRDAEAGAHKAWAKQYIDHRSDKKRRRNNQPPPEAQRPNGPRSLPEPPSGVIEPNIWDDGSNIQDTIAQTGTLSTANGRNNSSYNASDQETSQVPGSSVQLSRRGQTSYHRVTTEPPRNASSQNNGDQSPTEARTLSSNKKPVQRRTVATQAQTIASISNEINPHPTNPSQRSNQEIWDREIRDHHMDHNSTPKRKQLPAPPIVSERVGGKTGTPTKGRNSSSRGQDSHAEGARSHADNEPSSPVNQDRHVESTKSRVIIPPSVSSDGHGHLEDHQSDVEQTADQPVVGGRPESAEDTDSEYTDGAESEQFNGGASHASTNLEGMTEFQKDMLEQIDKHYPSMMKRSSEEDVLRSISVLHDLLIGLYTSRHDYRNNFYTKSNELDRKEKEWVANSKDMRKKYDEGLKKAREQQRKALAEANEGYEQQKASLRKQHADVATQESQANEEKLEMQKQEYEQKLLAKEEKLRKQKQEYEQKVLDKEGEISGLNQAHEIAIAKQIETHKNDKSTLATSHSTEKSKLEMEMTKMAETHKSEKELLEQRYKNEKETWEQEKKTINSAHDGKVNRIYRDWSNAKTTWDNDTAELKKHHEEEKNEILKDWKHAKELWDSERQGLAQTHQNQKNKIYQDWSHDRATWDTEKAGLIQIHENKENQIRQGWSNEKAQWTNDKIELKEVHKMEKKEQLEDHAKETALLVHNHDREKKRIEQNHNEELYLKDQDIATLQDTHTANLDKLGKHHSKEIDKLKKRLSTIDDDYLGQLATAQNSHKMAIKKIEEEHRKQIVKCQNDISQLEQQQSAMRTALIKKHEAELSQLAEDQKNWEAELQAKHTERLESLLDELKRSNKVLLAREDDPYLADIFKMTDIKREPDEHLKAHFLDFVQIVNNLSNLTWKEEQTLWPPEVLQNLGQTQNQRLLKKYILKDSIWSILHKNVFCSPFRAFGKEGLKLEEEWNQECGQDSRFDNGAYTWPEPGMETERWRYFTIKECRRILIKPLPSAYDPRVQLKRGWVDTMTNTISEIKTTLDELVKMKDSDSQKVDELVKGFAKLWLEYQLHRCRIVVSLTGTKLGKTSQKIAQVQKGSLELTIVPSLGRHGDVKGMELDTYTVIGGCGGESVSLP